LDTYDDRAQGRLNMHMLEVEDYRTHATHLVEENQAVSDKLVDTMEKLFDEKTEKQKYMALYEAKII